MAAGFNSGRYEPKVAVVGAGISGLAAAKEMKKYGPVVFEATDSIGGVWKHCSFRTTRLQSPRLDYEFSDYEWKGRNSASFPTHSEIMEYLHGYATHFDLWKHIHLRSRVLEVKFLGDAERAGSGELWGENGRPFSGQPMWEILVQKDGNEPKSYKFDFVVMCIGKYGDVRNVPAFPTGKGPEVFKGKVMHSLDYCKLGKQETQDLMKGKRVAVVGYKKSAIDLAYECAEANQGADGQPCTMIIRTPHWTVPSYSIWGLPFYIFFSTRFSQFLHERPDQGFLRSIFCSLFSPLRKGISDFIESYLKWKLPLEKYGLVPDHPFVEDYASCQMAVLPENFFDKADEGKIRFKKSSDWSFYEEGIKFQDGTKLEADVVLLATGFDGKKKLRSVLPAPFSGFIDNSSGIIQLYRGTIHPLIPHMAFIGYVESVSNLHTSELRCKWLERLLDEQFSLPKVKRMLEQITNEMETMKRTTRFYKRHCISTFSINHDDGMCQEMGWDTWRKNGWLSEAFSPYNNQDYKEENKIELLKN